MKNGTLKLSSYRISSPGKDEYKRVVYLQLYIACFESVSTKVVYLRRCLVATWLVPPKPAAISTHAMCTLCNHAPVYRFIGRHIRRVHRVHACLAVTCHLHVWQNDLELLRTDAVTGSRVGVGMA